MQRKWLTTVSAHLLWAASLAAGLPEWGTPPEGIELETAPDGMTVIRFNLTPDEPFMSGNNPRLGKDTALLFKEPLNADHADRVVFEAHGVLPDNRLRPYAVELRPMLRDEEGEIFDLFPVRTPALKEKDGGWAEYTTGNWFSGEAGAVSHGLCKISGKPGNSRPDGKLELLGFRLHLARAVPEATGEHKIEPLRGEIRIGSFETPNGKFPFSHPFFYADALCREPGTYRLTGDVTTEFQGEPVRGFNETFTYTPGEKRRITLTTGPDGYYWINWNLLGPDQTRLAGGEFKHQTFGNPDPTPPAVTPAPSRLRVRHAGRGVFPPGEPYVLEVESGGPGEVEYVLTPYAFSDVLAQGKVPASGKLEFPFNEQWNAYRLKLTRRDQGKLQESTEFIFGTPNDWSKPLRRSGAITDRHELKKQPYNRLSYTCQTGKPGQKSRQYFRDDFRKTLLGYRSWIQSYTVLPDLNDFEVLPGVYDFALLDDMMECAAELGCRLTVRIAHSDNDSGPYRWGKFSRQYASDGVAAGAGISYGSYEVTDPALTDCWLRAYRALHQRYAEHTAFEGYYIMLPAGEWTVVDQPWAGVIAGYTDESRQAFREWLQATYRTPEALARAWGTPVTAWEEIQLPLPDFSSGPVPDLRPAWLDFCRFKSGLATQFWMKKAVNDIRSYDQDRVTIAYTRPSELRHLDGLLDYGHNGGNHSLDRRGEYAAAWEQGKIGWITEPIHPHGWAAWNNPGRDGWVLDVSTWTMLAQAGGGGANLHVYVFNSTDPVGRQGGFFAFDRMERFIPILRELHGAQLIAPVSEIAVRQDPETLFAKHRTTFSARLLDLRRWFELVENDGFAPADLAAFPDRKFKLILPNVLDEVMSPETFDRCVRSVRDDGAKLLMTARTGSYVAGRGQEPFQLLRAFGITPPQGEYQLNGDFQATALAGNPLFPAGHRIDFQTLTRLRREMHSPEILKSFDQYPYRWIPETDYFGVYPAEKPNGEVLARFTSGGAAMTRHRVGKGEVIVFWGLPSMSGNGLQGMMRAAAAWAGIPAPDAAVPNRFEMTDPQHKRHYGIFYREREYTPVTVKFFHCPEGTYFADEMVSGRRLGVFTAQELRKKGIPLTWEKGTSPLKVVRLISNLPVWAEAYNQ